MIVSPLSSALVTASLPVLHGGEGDADFGTLIDGSASPCRESSTDDSALATVVPDSMPVAPQPLPAVCTWVHDKGAGTLDHAADDVADGDVAQAHMRSGIGADSQPALGVAQQTPALVPLAEPTNAVNSQPEPDPGGVSVPRAAATGPQLTVADLPLTGQVQSVSTPPPVTAAQRFWRMMDHQPGAQPDGDLPLMSGEPAPATVPATVAVAFRPVATDLASPADASKLSHRPGLTDPHAVRPLAAAEHGTHPKRDAPLPVDGGPVTAGVNLTTRDTGLIPLKNIMATVSTPVTPRDAMPLATTLTPQPFVQVLQAHVSSPVPDGVVLTLAPEELGRLQMIIQTTDDMLTIAIQADRPETVELMRRHADQLAQELRQAGFAQTNFSFSQGNSQGGMQGQGQNFARPQPAPEPAVRQTSPSPAPEPTPSQRRHHDNSAALDLRL